MSTPEGELADSHLCEPAGYAPPRRPGSIRRTSSLDLTWPQGRQGPLLLQGRARDALTSTSTESEKVVPRIAREDTLELLLGTDRSIRRLESSADLPEFQQFVGARWGGEIRNGIASLLLEADISDRPLSLLLDDVSPLHLIAPWALMRWDAKIEFEQQSAGKDAIRIARHPRENVCTGYRTGSKVLEPDAPVAGRGCPILPLANPGDPLGWHPLDERREVSMRRTRRIDLWVDGNIHVDADFQDSASLPEGGRVAVHEYRLTAEIDRQSERLVLLQAVPHALPWPECLNATDYLTRLINLPLCELRSQVVERLGGPSGCTHLNDAIRVLACAPVLLKQLYPN